jgi:heptosyltransferase III
VVPDVVNLDLVKRALVIKLRHHGDVLLASPVISALKSRAAHLEIDALVYADTAPMLAGHPAMSQLHTIDREWRRRGMAVQVPAEFKLFRSLKARSYDLIVHLTEAGRGAWLARALGSRYSVARKRPEWWWKKCFTHTYSLPSHALRHTVEKDLDALRRIGIHPSPAERKLVLAPDAAAKARVAALLAPHAAVSDGYIHVHPTSRWMFKSWPAERMSRTLAALAADGHALVLTAAPSANEKAMVARILSQLPSAASARLVDLSGQLSLAELAVVSHGAKLFLGVDSAPMHIAASQGTPTVALFGPSGEAEWGPWLVPHRIVSTAHPCRPCGQDGCGGGKVSECLTMLPEADVLAATRALLQTVADGRTHSHTYAPPTYMLQPVMD